MPLEPERVTVISSAEPCSQFRVHPFTFHHSTPVIAAEVKVGLPLDGGSERVTSLVKLDKVLGQLKRVS